MRVNAATGVVATAAAAAAASLLCGVGADALRAAAPNPLVATVHPARAARGLMVTSGGWAYCKQAQGLARRTHYTLLCGTYFKDGYRGPRLRADRHLDWGERHYLASFARTIRALRRRVGGRLVMVGASYAGYGVAVLASHHPELHPDHVIVVDSYFDLVARRERLLPTHPTAREIDAETGGSTAALRTRSVWVGGLARLVRTGTKLTVVWTVSEHERTLFRGATCDRSASARTLARLAEVLDRPVAGWVTRARHGSNLWNHGRGIVRGRNPGTKILFRPRAPIPRAAICE